jgi:hypothetical protein
LENSQNNVTKLIPVGNQYLFFFPLGKVYTPPPATTLQQMFEQQWPDRPVPVVRDASLRLTAYDLFFTRYLICSMPILVTCPDGLTHTRIVSFSEYSKFGFAADLSRIYYRCLKQALYESCPSHYSRNSSL